MAVLRKANSPKRSNQKIQAEKDPRRKTDSNFDFPKLPSAYEVLTRRNAM